MAKNTAFTLAEVLITLGIIGIVAAMTTPNLIAQQQKRTTVTKLQHAMSVLNQAYRRAYDDVGEATAEEAFSMGSEAYFNKFWAPYIKAAHICKTYKDCGYDKSLPINYNNGTNSNISITREGLRTAVLTMDGFVYVILTGSGAVNNIHSNSDIYVDINGAAKPNVVGKDVFILTRIIDGEKGGVVLPKGYNKTLKKINSDCKKNSSGGTYCAEKIRRAGWQIDKSYPW